MADDTGVEVAMDVTGVEDVLDAHEPPPATSTGEAPALSTEPSPSQDAIDDVEPPASTSAAVGKRAIDADADADADELEKDQSGEGLPPRKKARKGFAAGSTSSSAEESPSPPEVPQQPAAPGIAVSGLRTSFARPAAPGPTGVRTSFDVGTQKRVGKGNSAFRMHTPLTADERDHLIAVVRDLESLEVKPVHKRSLNWTVGPIRNEWIVGNTWLEIWESMIDKWCEAFLYVNQAHIAQVGLAPSMLKTAFEKRLLESGKDLPSIFKQITRAQCKNPETSRLRNFADSFKPDQEKLTRKQVRIAAKSVAAGKDTINSVPETDNSSPTNAQTHADQEEPATEDQQNENEMEDGEITSGDTSGADMVVEEDAPPISQVELDQRHRYFPNIPDDAVFCLTCAQVGHATASCPDLTCKFCQGAHFKYECPTRQRCAKCKQLGHTRTACPEKLAVAPGEVAIECAVCEGHDHTEVNCIQLYQIYRPQPGKVKKVKSLPVFCYACGTEGHYGGDCSLADPTVPPTKVWTMSTASLYIEPNSSDVALSYRNALPPPPEVTRPVIPGRSIKPQTHVIFEESDGEGDGDFIPPNNGGPSLGNKRGKKSKDGPAIQIASNISFGSSATGGPPNRQQQQQQQQAAKKQKGPAQPPKKSKKPGNDAQPGNKLTGGRHTRSRNPAPPASQSANSTSARNSQPPSQRGGSGGRGASNAGRGRGGFSQLASKRPRRPRRGQGG